MLTNETTTKRCSKCGQRLPATEFNRDVRRTDGLMWWCRACCKASRLRRRLDPAAREADAARTRNWYAANREGRAAHNKEWREKNADRIQSYRSNRAESKAAYHRLKAYGLSDEDFAAMLAAQGGACAICQRITDRPLHVDHDHETGRVRGLLCYSCNAALGSFGDSPARLLSALAYLASPQ